MKKAFILTLVAVMAVLLVLFLRPASVQTTPLVTGSNVLALEPLKTEVLVGDTVVVNLVARDVSDVFGVQLSMDYNPETLMFLEATEGSFLSRNGADQTLKLDVLKKNNPGLVKDFVLVKLSDAGTSGSGVIGTFTFQARTAGTAQIALVDVIVADKSAQRISVGTVGTTISVQ